MRCPSRQIGPSLIGRRIWVAGHRGMAGAAICRAVRSRGGQVVAALHSRLDIGRKDATADWLRECRPDAAIVAVNDGRYGRFTSSEEDPSERGTVLSHGFLESVFRAGIRDAVVVSCADRTGEGDTLDRFCERTRRDSGFNYSIVRTSGLFGSGGQFGIWVPDPWPDRAVVGKPRSTWSIMCSHNPMPEFVRLLHVDDAAACVMSMLGGEYYGPPRLSINGPAYRSEEIERALALIVNRTKSSGFNVTPTEGKFLQRYDERPGFLIWTPSVTIEEGLREFSTWCHQAFFFERPLQGLDVAVLAGGLGTRLRPILSDRPKVLAPVAGRAYLDRLLDWLDAQGAEKIVLCLGHRAEQVKGHLATYRPRRAKIEISIESSPLGTAGALRLARSRLGSDPALIMNGDTFVAADLVGFRRAHALSRSAATLLCARVENCGRYSNLVLDRLGRIDRFVEKDAKRKGAGLAGAGVYLFSQEMLDDIAASEATSLEQDILERASPGSLGAVIDEAGFCDIGTPEGLVEAVDFISEQSAFRQSGAT